MSHGSQCGPSSPGSRLDADYPENGVLIPRRFTIASTNAPVGASPAEIDGDRIGSAGRRIAILVLGSRPAIFAGNWTGTWSNSVGESGTETLYLKESSDGTFTGSWDGIEVTGKRQGDNEILFQGSTSRRAYRVIGRITNLELRLSYSVRRLDSEGSYYGQSRHKRTVDR